MASAFSVTTFPIMFHKVLFVPGARPDLRICFLALKSIVGVFVPNAYLAIIDLSPEIPSISMFDQGLAKLAVRGGCITSPLPNHVIDLETGSVI
jgi:hypothetical protein